MTDRIKALVALAEDHERIAASVRDTIRGPDSMSPKDHARAAKTIRAALAASQPAPDCHQSDLVTADSSQPAQPVPVKVRPLVWERHKGGCFTLKSMKSADNGCDVVYYAERANPSGHVVSTVTKPGYFRCVIENRIGANSEFGCIEAAKAAAQTDYEARIMAALDVQPITVQDAALVLLISSDRGVCVGGRWDGWLMIRHPDGHWVSHHKLDAVDPRTEMTDALRAIAEDKV